MCDCCKYTLTNSFAQFIDLITIDIRSIHFNFRLISHRADSEVCDLSHLDVNQDLCETSTSQTNM